MNGREEGGQYYILQTRDQEPFDARTVVFFRGSIPSFLELVVADVEATTVDEMVLQRA